MRTSFCVALLFVASHAVSGIAKTSANSKLTASEQELVTLMTDFYAALETYWADGREYKTLEAYNKAAADGIIVDPNVEYIPKLLVFEAEHRGKDVGLLALRHVFREAARGARIDSSANVGRRNAVTHLAAYTDSKLLPLVVSRAMSGCYDPKVYESVTDLVRTHTLPRESHDILSYHLARRCFKTRDLRDRIAKRLEVLRAGGEPSLPDELSLRLATLETLPSTEKIQQHCNAATKTLEELASNDNSPRFSRLLGIDEKWYVVRAIEDSSYPLLAEKAAAVLFKELHLKAGAPAPDLEVKLLNDTLWRMADQRGKVVIVQFSFTGCGPCERMYPDLASLSVDYGDEVAILTLMRDKTPENALKAIESGKITWSVAIDGNPGSIVTEWSVSSFPETYVVDRDGKIAAHNLHSKRLSSGCSTSSEKTRERASVGCVPRYPVLKHGAMTACGGKAWSTGLFANRNGKF